jgi:hypothetical protein
MKTISTICMALCMFFTLNIYGQNTLAKDSGNLVKQIMKSADVTKTQAMGGSGALFEMAKGNMEKEDFEKVSDVVPNMGDMLGAIPDVGGKTSMLESTVKTLSGMPKVVAVFDKLGISQDKISLFTPVIVKYVEKKGGKILADKLGNSFK